MSVNHFPHLVHHAFEESKKLPPTAPGKSAVVGFLWGFLGGPIGAAIYLRSFKDCAILFGLLIAGTILTGGLAGPVFWTLCGVWAYVRVRNSAAHHNKLNAAPEVQSDV